MDEVAPDLAAHYERLDELGKTLAKTRSEAIEGRQNSGIEEEWLEDEEYYEGVDDANRGEQKAWNSKPLGQQQLVDDTDEETGSTIFPNITRPYVDSASARVGDMLFPAEEAAFKLKATPKPEILELSEVELEPEHEQQLADGQANESVQLVDAARKEIEKAEKSAKKASTQILDWHVESDYNTHNRRVIEDAAKVGTGVLKGPIPVKTTKMVLNGDKLERKSEIKPASLRISYRNFFPDPSCGEDIHNGAFTWERDDLTSKSLLQLLGVKGYIDDQIRQVIKEGPMMATKEWNADQGIPGLRKTPKDRKKLFEIWYMYGMVDSKDLFNIQMLSNGADPEKLCLCEDEHVHIHLTMVNNRVIKATLSHLETGKFPYDLMVWQRRMGMPWGSGVARQVRPAQRIITGATRHMMDNAGVAGGPICFIDTTVAVPDDGINEIKPWKLFVPAEDYASSGVDKKNFREAVQFSQIPMVQAEMMGIIEYGLRLAEEVTGMPMIMQGQTSGQTPSTLGGMQMQNNNANSVLRRIARLYDDMITLPHIQRYYEFILEHSDDPEMKVELSVQALASSTLVERDIADSAVLNLGQFVTNPIFKADPAKWFIEMLKTQKLQPSRFEYEDEQWQQIVEQLAQPPANPAAEIAQQKLQSDQQVAQFKAQNDKEMEQLKSNAKAELTTLEAALKSREADRARLHEATLSQLEKEFDVYIKQIGEKGSDSRNLQTIKQKLQDTILKLKTQLQLSGTQAITPAVEPRGRAPDGQAFEK